MCLNSQAWKYNFDIFLLQIHNITFQETDRLLGQQYSDDTGYYDTVKVRHLFK